MPCSAAARGTRAASIHNPPFNDTTDNNPCGKQIVATVKGGTDVSAHSLCLPHLMAKLGQKDVGPPYTFAA